ncbi:MAG TPA: hypothetical protein VIF40_09820 [Methylosinus sp.]|jgi:KDO2-lipid IV(A) lauroyltransferase|uniref:LpxL/LpxP family acyltransferase n=1 Tax=Methylosinus sp. TaxID=427 RepID=UPI002F93B1E2
MTIDLAFAEAIARLPLRARRRALRLAWRAAASAKRLPDFEIDSGFRRFLRLSGIEAERLNREAVFHDRLVSLEWLAMLRRTVRQLESDARFAHIDGEDTLAHVAATGKPIILAPIHMGCFALVFGKMMQRFFHDRPMLILRAREDRETETAVMQRIGEIGIDMRLLNVKEKANYVDAARFARNGAVIVYFVDLPGSYGGSFDASLFGQQVKLAMGIDSFARITEGIVVPARVRSTLDGDEMRLGAPFECAETGPAEKARVADMVRRHIERSVLDAPAQWYFWSRFAEYLDHSSESTAAAQ